MINFVDEHIKAFEVSLKGKLSPDELGGKPWKTFCRDLTGVDITCFNPADQKGRISRSEVFALAKNETIETRSVCAAALAWGDMRMHLHKDLFKAGNDEWIEVANETRNASIDRQTAYEEFRRLRTKRSMKGLGPAFFTKLIYFLSRHGHETTGQGFIMDQWAACSINLLVGRPVVHLNFTMSWPNDASSPDYKFTVSDLNSGEHYEDFCQAIDALIYSIPDYSSDTIDRAFLGGGNDKHANWRNHVLEHRVP